MSELDPQAFKQALAGFAAGVTVVCAEHDGEKAGFTATSFTSVSLDPPLVLVCLNCSADSHKLFEQASRMGISILSAGQGAEGWTFAKRGEDKFGKVPWHYGAEGTPLVDGALAYLECDIHERLPGGDHTILIGKVRRAERASGEPLLYFDKQFGGFEPEAKKS